ncbi:hypothetical protein [Dokdonella fugitiva]|uniref:hypothetical protein n=1 Tax=Dokdonella fugitiva TaxID=328517 RepID=UPI0015FB8B4A|nr:hypothetical protein [Dokdonella fugitiva]MBA8883836.1 hypothetical protein [Dokdonella fugitiva]
MQYPDARTGNQAAYLRGARLERATCAPTASRAMSGEFRRAKFAAASLVPDAAGRLCDARSATLDLRAAPRRFPNRVGLR